MDVHLKPDVAVALESTSRRPLIDTIINTLRRNDTIHALYMQGAWMSTSQLNRLFEMLATTRIYALSLGENEVSSTDIQILIPFPSPTILNYL